jgi:hypothetical protein
MTRNPVPWVGLLGLVAMFVIPFLPDWIFEGPRTVRHWPRRHVCGACGAGWTSGHVCDAAEPEPALADRTRSEGRGEPEPALPNPAPVRRDRLVGELRRLDR